MNFAPKQVMIRHFQLNVLSASHPPTMNTNTAPPETTTQSLPADIAEQEVGQDSQAASAVEESIDLQAVISSLLEGDADAAAKACAVLESVVREQPQNPIGFLGLGIARARQGRFHEAEHLFNQAVQHDPKLASGWSNLGNLYKLHGRREEAMTAYRKAIGLQPGLADAHYNMAVVLDEMGQRAEAEESLKRALLFRPNHPEAHNNLGLVHLKSGQVEQALSHFRQALVWDSKLRQARFNLIVALYRLNRTAEAQAEVDQLLADKPDDAEVLRVQAAGLAQQGRFDDAEAVNSKLLALDPEAIDVQLNRGELMLARQDFEGALACYRELLGKSNVPPAIGVGAMANVMLAQGNYSSARDLFQQALMLDARLPSLTLGLAKSFLGAGEVALGLQTLRRAVELLPHLADVHSLLIHALPLDAQGDGDGGRAEEIATWLRRHGKQGERSGAYNDTAASGVSKKPGEALRVAFLIGETEDPCTMEGLVALIGQLDSRRVDTYIYHVGGRVGPIGARLQAAAGHWRPAVSLGATDLAEQVRQDGIDVWIDRVGHGPGSRLQAFAELPAPVQIAWAADFADPGLPQMAWRFADAALEPSPGPELLCLPAPFPYVPPADQPALPPRDPAAGLVLGVISALARINARVLDTWAEILRGLPDARLVIFSDTATADDATRERLRRLFLLRDVSADRLEILPRLADRGATLQALSTIDLVLDTFPVVAGAAAMDCLSLGIPVLTLTGTSAGQRLTASLLAQADLGAWVAADVGDYVAKATAATAAQLQSLRGELPQRLRLAPAVDAAAMAAALTALVEQAVKPQDKGD